MIVPVITDFKAAPRKPRLQLLLFGVCTWLEPRREWSRCLRAVGCRRYEGGFQDGAFHGDGAFTRPEPSPGTYTGAWAEGVPHGQGAWALRPKVRAGEHRRQDGTAPHTRRPKRLQAHDLVYSAIWIAF